VWRLGDQDTVIHPNDTHGLVEHDLDLARIAIESTREVDGALAGNDGRQVDDGALRLGCHLLGDDEDVPVGQWQGVTRSLDRVADESREIGPASISGIPRGR
jgi:hypothetical protein